MAEEQCLVTLYEDLHVGLDVTAVDSSFVQYVFAGN